jgi:hypothetical protein
MRRALFLALVVLSLSAVRAEAVTAKDIIDLTRAGLGEEVLLALIEVDGSLFTIDTETLKSLKAAGVSDRVIEAMVRSGRMPQEAPAPFWPAVEPEPPQPQVIVIEHERPVVEQVAVPVPVYIPVQTRPRGRHQTALIVSQPLDPSPGFGAASPPQYQRKPASPVYWGWGGKLRPDAWKPAPDSRHVRAPKPESAPSPSRR